MGGGHCWLQGGDTHLGCGRHRRAGQGLGAADGDVDVGDRLPQGHGNSRTWPQPPKLSGGLSSPSKGGQEEPWMLAAPASPPWSPHQCHHRLPPSPRLTCGLWGSKLAKLQGIRESGGAVRSRTGQRSQGTSSHCDRNKGTLTFNLFLQHCQVISYFRFQLIDFKNPGKKTLMY